MVGVVGFVVVIGWWVGFGVVLVVWLFGYVLDWMFWMLVLLDLGLVWTVSLVGVCLWIGVLSW